MAAGEPVPGARVLTIRGAAHPPKLLDRVRQAIRMRHYSRRTESAYVHWVRRFIVFHGKKHPDQMGASEVTAFLSWLATHQGVSASTQNQALSAILFLYKHVVHKDLGRLEPATRAKTPHRVPVVLSREEVGRVLGHLTGRMWVIAGLLQSQETLWLHWFWRTLRRRSAVRVRPRKVWFGFAAGTEFSRSFNLAWRSRPSPRGTERECRDGDTC